MSGTRRLAHSGAPGAVGLALAAVLLGLSLLGRAALTDCREELRASGERTESLREERTRLRIALDSAIDLAEIERRAVNEMGMCRPAPEQIRYEEAAPPDVLTPAAAGEEERLWAPGQSPGE